MVAYQERHEFHGLKHMAIPLFGAVANVACMAFYIIGPIEGLGSVKEPLMAVGIAVVWGAYGAFYFARNSKKRGKRHDAPGEARHWLRLWISRRGYRRLALRTALASSGLGQRGPWARPPGPVQPQKLRGRAVAFFGLPSLLGTMRSGIRPLPCL